MGGKGRATRTGRDEEIADDGEDGDEPLQACWRSKALHRPLTSSQRQVRVLGPVIEALVRAMLDRGHDLRRGLPLADRPKFTAWASGLTRFTGPLSSLSVVPKIFAMKRYMEERLEATRETGSDGLMAELVRVEKEGRRISRDEMVAMLFLLLFAGHETTTHLISGSVRELLRKPGTSRLAGRGLESR